MTSTEAYSESSILDELRKRKPLLDAVCVTGGEPTVQPDLKNFLQKVKDLGYLVKLDTNGVHPRLLQSILEANLVDYVAMDIKQIFSAYETVIDVPAEQIAVQIMESQTILGNSPIAHEFRTTIWGDVHTRENLLDIARQLPLNSRYALQPVRSVVTLNTKVLFSPGIDLQNLCGDIQKERPDLEVLVRE
jgi:pyruvate formate lyase activating enzyme